MKRWPFAVLLALVPLLGACSEDDNNPVPTGPTTPVDVVTFTEVFEGQLMQDGRSRHLFSLVANGAIAIEVQEVAPLSTLTLGIELGAIDENGNCAVFGVDDSVRQGEIFLSDEVPAGDFCVTMVDVGNIFPGQTVTYIIEVRHT